MEKVIFDTNAYRYLVTDKEFDEIDKVVAKLKSKEAQKGLESMISPIVAKELLAHAADKRNLNLNRDHVLDAENNFALTLQQFVRNVDPTSKGWRIFSDDPAKRQNALANIRSI